MTSSIYFSIWWLPSFLGVGTRSYESAVVAAALALESGGVILVAGLLVETGLTGVSGVCSKAMGPAVEEFAAVAMIWRWQR